MIIGKFFKDFGKGNKNAQTIIEEIVNEFFLNEKVTEESLRELKAKVADATKHIKVPTEKGSVKSDVKSETQSQKGGNLQKQPSNPGQNNQSNQNKVEDDKKSRSSKASKASDLSSDTSSMAPKSVYYVEGEEDDEWATLVKFDTELFKKEKELERIR